VEEQLRLKKCNNLKNSLNRRRGFQRREKEAQEKQEKGANSA